jgi:hypothetical protein
MAETVAKVLVSSPTAIKVRVNNGAPSRVQSIQYAPSASFSVQNATDVQISDNLTDRAVLTYNQSTDKFVVQDVPRLEGGTF